VSNEERSDAELLTALADDSDALDEFYRRHRGRVIAYAARRCRQPADVADLVAATFVAAITASHRYDPNRGPAEAWLIGIASRQWSLWCRAEHKQVRLSRESAHRSLSSDDIARLEEQIDAKRDSARVEAALEKIEQRHREVLWLIGPDGLTLKEAAAVQGISIGTFRVRLLRARRALRAVLAECSSPINIRAGAHREAPL
jgi:RNA polymerase sigma factor (sigma-70 family)